MSGQGCPHFVFRYSAMCLTALTLLHALVPTSIAARPQNRVIANQVSQPSKELRMDLKTRLRISWGGGSSQTWKGKISFSGGSLSDVTPISLTADASASVKKIGDDLIVDHWSPTNYGGVDVEYEGRSNTTIRIVLNSVENPDSVFERTTTVGELVDGVFGGDIDSLGNRCSITRVPGDTLEFSFEKDHLVFKPGETFRFAVRPNLTGLATRSANCRVKVAPVTANGPMVRGHFSKTIAVELDGNGSSTKPTEFEFEVPQKEAIYNIEIELEPVWYQASFSSKKTIRRSVQFIVLGDNPPIAANQRAWRQISVADSVMGNNRSTLPGWDQFSKMARLPNRTVIGNESRRQITFGQTQMMELLAGGWQVIPLDVDRIDKPHVIELEYVADGEIALGLSLLQPDVNGEVALYGFDSGVHVPPTIVGKDNGSPDGEIQQHRLTVWPKTKAPYLLIANRHADAPVKIGKVRVFAGPDRLEPSSVSTGAAKQDRKLMAFYESPLFPENFGANKAMDPNFGEPLDDWKMFYLGANRLIEYLKANSYRGAFITVACDGSSVYPSQLLNSSPKHDNGRFFSNGQDPIQKDILEMMFRMFEREGLLLVPALALSGPLPEVEQSRVANEVAESDLVDLNLVRRQRSVGGNLPLYNPLNRNVQRSVTRVVEELARRYKGYSSFDGVAIICRPDTYTLLPGRQWGYDESTIRQFLQSYDDGQTELAGPRVDTAETIRNVLLGSGRKQWTQWRAKEMTIWYQSMLAAVRSSLPEGNLYLAPVDLYRNEETASALSPSLHGSSNYQQSMLHMGFDLEAIEAKNEGVVGRGVVLLNPHRIAPDKELASRRVDDSIEHSDQAKSYFAKSSYSGDLFTHRVSWAHFAQLQEQGPFGNQSAPLMRLQQMAPAGQFNRMRFAHSIKDRDARMLVDGGWMLTMGQESALLDMMRVFGRLPDQKFADVTSTAHAETALESLPIAVRQLNSDSGTHFYAVNDSPWPIKLAIQFETDSVGDSPQVFSLASPSPNKRFEVESSQGIEGKATPRFEFEVEIPAYGLIGGRSEESSFVVTDFSFELPDGADKVLKKRVYALQAKLIKSANPSPLPVIENHGFESLGSGSLNGWNSGSQATGKVQLDQRASLPLAPGQSISSCLVMNSQDNTPVWVRSKPFDGPETGRISISVWLRTDDPSVQPPLRLAVEGQSDGTSYYRFGSVGSLSPDPNVNQVGQNWKRFAVHFDDLPVAGLTNVRIGFDLMGPGQVNIDNVQVFDRWFDENDAKAITQILASTGPLLSNQEKFDSCRKLLSGYWPQFLARYAASEVPAAEPVPNVDQSVDFSKIGEPDEFASPGMQEEYSQQTRRSPMFRRFRNLTPRNSPQRQK